MNLTTNYLGFELASPLVPGASPLSDNLDAVRRLEDAGAPIITMHSLFEEQITREELAFSWAVETPMDSYAEALSYFPDPDDFELGPDEYLEQIRRIKATVAVPVVASLNGVTPGGWIRYAELIQQAGADALELNLYGVAADPHQSAASVEERMLEVVRRVREAISIPIAIKLSPFYSSLANFAVELDNAGADGLVLFNRFYQPDVDIENLDVLRVLSLSDSSELLLRLRWVAILYHKIKASLAVTGGVHTASDAIKGVMVGADVCQMTSALLQRGPGYLKTVREDLVRWLEEHEYESLAQMRGSMSLERTPDPGAYERANYARILQTWRDQSL